VPLLRSYKPRHAKPSKAAPALVTVGTVGGMTASMGALATTAHAASADDFARLRQCESGNNYRANTGNGYYGAYQFDLRTWEWLGYWGWPSEADPEVQDQAARDLYDYSNWDAWPSCSRWLGLKY
jgi:resuscitation-promoting factor RpfA